MKKRKVVSKDMYSIFIVDMRETSDYSNRSYIYVFEESDVHLRVWNAFMSLKAANKFYFPNVGDSGYQDLVHEVSDRRGTDCDFQDFFDVAMDHDYRFPKDGHTMQSISECSWIVYIVEE